MTGGAGQTYYPSGRADPDYLNQNHSSYGGGDQKHNGGFELESTLASLIPQYSRQLAPQDAIDSMPMRSHSTVMTGNPVAQHDAQATHGNVGPMRTKDGAQIYGPGS